MTAQQQLRLLGYPELKLKGIKFSRSELRRREHAGTFPQRVRLGEGLNPTVAWVESEIDAWITSRMAARTTIAARVS